MAGKLEEKIALVTGGSLGNWTRDGSGPSCFGRCKLYRGD